MHWTQRPAVRKKISETLKRKGIMPPVDKRSHGGDHHNWKGGVIFNNGYKLIKCDDPNHPHQYRGGYVYEHRRNMEKHIGRFLEPNEKVHHVNGDITDNRIENLSLCASNSDHFKKFHKDIISSIPKQRHRPGNGPPCPRCGGLDVVSKGVSWKCWTCNRHFVKSGKHRL